MPSIQGRQRQAGLRVFGQQVYKVDFQIARVAHRNHVLKNKIKQNGVYLEGHIRMRKSESYILRMFV